MNNLKIWWNNKLLNGGVILHSFVAIMSVIINLLFSTLIIWITGLLLISGLAALPHITYMQCLYQLLNTSFIYQTKGIILYRKEVDNGEIILLVKLIYIVGIKQYIVSDDKYHLNEKTTLRSIIQGYKKMIDEMNEVTKI
jgi:hypothetical protein